MKNVIESPLISSSKARLLRTIDVKDLTSKYKKKFKIDVSSYFHDIEKIGVYICDNTKYTFYYPFHIYGDGAFYEKLQAFEWYYMPWKWEHSKIKSLLTEEERILEVGSGNFGFIERMQTDGYHIYGLELNQNSVLKAQKMNLNVIDQSIESLAENQANLYDVICSFQVLEHIYDVNSFINAQIKCLKKGGKLIVSVPNNDSFIKLSDGGGLLNKPPHHMGLWNRESLENLADCFNLTVEKIFYEPLQDYHLNWYVDTLIKSRIKPYKIIYKIFKKIKLKRLFVFYVKFNQKNIHGHTMLAIYKKK